MENYSPPINKKGIPPILFKKIHQINSLALKAPQEKKVGVLSHLTNIFEAYNYVYYAYLVDKFLKNKKGRVVDWGGFCGQVTVLLNSLGYKCENYILEYPSQKHLFEELDIPYRLHTDPKRLPYNDNSCLALISSGVLEHVETDTNITDENALKEIFRVLKPGGFFFCWNLPRKLAFVEILVDIRKKGVHPKRYTSMQFKALLKEAGFHLKYLDVHGDILKIRGLRSLLYKFNPWTSLVIDYYISKLPFINLFSHHITAVAQKPHSCKTF